jgi:hypothetical protein
VLEMVVMEALVVAHLFFQALEDLETHRQLIQAKATMAVQLEPVLILVVAVVVAQVKLANLLLR